MTRGGIQPIRSWIACRIGNSEPSSARLFCTASSTTLRSAAGRSLPGSTRIGIVTRLRALTTALRNARSAVDARVPRQATALRVPLGWNWPNCLSSLAAHGTCRRPGRCQCGPFYPTEYGPTPSGSRQGFERRGMKLQVITDKRGDEIVAVVVALLTAQLQRLADRG